MIRVVQTHGVPADLVLDVVVGFVEVLPVHHQLALFVGSGCGVLGLEGTNQLQRQSLLPPRGKMVAGSGMVSPIFQPNCLASDSLDDGAGARVAERLHLFLGDVELGHQVEVVRCNREVREEIFWSW